MTLSFYATSGVDYGRYTTYQTLKDLNDLNPDLWISLVDLAWDDLHGNYEFSGEEYPLEGREDIITEWRVVFNDRNGTEKQQTSILTMLFYAIWTQDISISRKGFTASHRTSSGPTSATHNSQSAQAAVRQTISTNRSHARLVGMSPNAQDAAAEQLEPDVQPTKILQHLLKKAVEKFGERYSGWLEEHPNAKEELSSFLRPEVWDICREVGKDGFTLEQLLSISGDLSHDRPAVYLHIIWDPTTGPLSYRLYVGQGESLEDRLRNHENPWYRSRHPCLHYHVWDSHPANKSAFVILAQDMEMDPVALNLLEEWGALIFQTLQKNDLLDYLPNGTVLFPQAGNHLNVAHPLWQRFSVTKQDTYVSTDPYERREKYSQLIRDSDGEVKDYYLGIRQSFLSLKDSKDPIMKDYYLSAFRKSRGSHSTSVRKQIRHEILGGVTWEVWRDRAGGCIIAFAQINLRIRQGQIRLNHGDKVHLQGFLTPGLNPNVYAIGATSDDPARRLSLQLTGENHGCNFQIWLTVGGDKTTMTVNTLVDILEGATYDEIEKRPRRMLRTDESKSRTKRQYTS